MARRERDGLTKTAEGLGAALGHVAARLEAWKKERDDMTAAIHRILRAGHGILEDLGSAPIAGVRARVRKGKGGRPKGYKMSDETKKKLRAAWKRRKAAMKDGNTANG